jgi:hypothetical protein
MNLILICVDLPISQIGDVEAKVKLTLCFSLTEQHVMKANWGSGGIAPVIHSLTSALDGGEWPASRPGRFTSRHIAPDTHWIGGWVGPRAVLDAVVKRKIPSTRRESNPRTKIKINLPPLYTSKLFI